jgi:hypothetical protein
VNSRGHPPTLVAAHPGNTNAVKSGVFSSTGRILAPRAKEISNAIMAAPHVSALDRIAAEEVGSLIALVEAIDRDLANNGLTKKGEARSLLKLRVQYSRRIQEWCDRFGLNPKARAELLRDLGATSVAVELARRREAGAGE